ncbi:hypothetical protein F4X10_01705 [Candidatus Poribacteria bacterium]|nr:hypothetical protein [Candidatus Poribacteria bacterium]
MTNSIVALRAYRDGLHLIIRPHLSIADVEEAIQEEMSRMNQPLNGASVQIDLKGPTLKKEEMEYLKSKLQETYNLKIRSIEAFDEQAPPPIAAAPTTHALPQRTDPQHTRDSEPSRIIPHTIRSGQSEDYPQGSLIIYGDVNSGAEVRAGGDIVVLGALRGNAHAGISGRLSAVIISMDLVPVQLQIGDFISHRPINQKSRGYPEIARIGVEDVIIVEKFVKF